MLGLLHGLFQALTLGRIDGIPRDLADDALIEGVHIQRDEVQGQVLRLAPLRVIALPQLEGVAAALTGLFIGHMEP